MSGLSEKEAFAKMFWGLAREARGHDGEPDKFEIVEELECMEMHVGWPRLRARCQSILSEIRPPMPAVARS